MKEALPFGIRASAVLHLCSYGLFVVAVKWRSAPRHWSAFSIELKVGASLRTIVLRIVVGTLAFARIIFAVKVRLAFTIKRLRYAASDHVNHR